MDQLGGESETVSSDGRKTSGAAVTAGTPTSAVAAVTAAARTRAVAPVTAATPTTSVAAVSAATPATSVTTITTGTRARANNVTSKTAATTATTAVTATATTARTTPGTSAKSATAVTADAVVPHVRERMPDVMQNPGWQERRRPKSVISEGLSVHEMLKVLQVGGTRVAPAVPMMRNGDDKDDEDEDENANEDAKDDNNIFLDSEDDVRGDVSDDDGAESSEAVSSEKGSSDASQLNESNEGDDEDEMDNNQSSQEVVTVSARTRDRSGVSKRVEKATTPKVSSNSFYIPATDKDEGTVIARLSAKPSTRAKGSARTTKVTAKAQKVSKARSPNEKPSTPKPKPNTTTKTTKAKGNGRQARK